MEAIGRKCVHDVTVAGDRKSRRIPPDPSNGFYGLEYIQASFWHDYNEHHRSTIIKLHDSLTFRLGPMATAQEEEDYKALQKRTIDAEADQMHLTWQLCQEAQRYAGELRQMAAVVTEPTAALSTPASYAVAVETAIAVPAPSRSTVGTGFWLENQIPNKCSLSSVDVALYVRIKNLKSTKAMVTAYNIFAIGGELLRLKADIQPIYLILGHGVLKPHRGVSAPVDIPVPSGNVGIFLQVPLKDADLAVSNPLIGDFLDKEIGTHYIEPGDDVRGWAFFQYSNEATIPGSYLIKITDGSNQTYTYTLPPTMGNQSGDTLRRLLAVGPSIDLSECVMQPHPLQ